MACFEGRICWSKDDRHSPVLVNGIQTFVCAVRSILEIVSDLQLRHSDRGGLVHGSIRLAGDECLKAEASRVMFASPAPVLL